MPGEVVVGFRHNTVVSEATRCAAGLAAVAIVTFITIGSVRPENSDFSSEFGKFKKRYYSLIFFAFVRKNLDPEKLIPLIIPLIWWFGSMDYYVLSFLVKSIMSAPNIELVQLVQNCAIVQAIGPAFSSDLRKRIWQFRNPVVFDWHMSYDAEYCLVSSQFNRLLDRSCDDPKIGARILCIFNFVEFLVYRFIREIVPKEVLLRLIRSSLDLSRVKIYCRWYSKRKLSPGEYVLDESPILDFYCIDEFLNHLKSLDLYKLDMDYLEGGHNLFYIFFLFLAHELPLVSTYSEFIQSRKERLDLLRFYSSDKQEIGLLFFLAQSGFSLMKLIGLQIGPKTAFMFLIKRLKDIWTCFHLLNLEEQRCRKQLVDVQKDPQFQKISESSRINFVLVKIKELATLVSIRYEVMVYGY